MSGGSPGDRADRPGGDDAVAEEARAGDPVALTRALVRTPSVNPSLDPSGDGEEAAARLTASWLREWGFQVAVAEVAPGRFNTVGVLGEGDGPVLLLNGHLDTVGVEGMSVPPFDAAVDPDGRIHGRGSCDMKGGVAALLAAGAGLAGTGGPAAGRLVVALTADEEHASVGMEALVAGSAGSEPVRADAAVVCEPTGLSVMPAHKGFVWLDLLFRGRAAHGSRPELGIDAVRHASLYLARLEAVHGALAGGPSHPLLGRPSFHAGTIRGGTAASVYPAECRLTLERRTLPGEDGEAVVAPFRDALDALRGEVDGLDAELTSGLTRPGTEVASDHPLVRGLLDAADEEGLDRRVEGMTAWVDAAFLNEAGIPAVCFGPGSIARAHAADEWVEADEVRRCAGVLERFARRFLAGGPSVR